jgi:hypothetical protein
MAKRPELPKIGEIGDETIAPVKWMVPRWHEIKHWFGIGFFSGVGIVTALIAVLPAGNIGAMLGTVSLLAFGIAAILVYFGRYARGLRLEEYKMKLDAWERQVKEDVKDTLLPDFEAKHKALDGTIADLRTQSRDWQNEVVTLQTERNDARSSVVKAIQERDTLTSQLRIEEEKRRAAESTVSALTKQIGDLQKADTSTRADAAARIFETIAKLGK